MAYPRLKTIEIQGFRAFGAKSQEAQIDTPIAVLWGPNSKGKTSVAEAIEFLLTGQTVKRQILSSRQDEFADALRHVHLDTETESFVSATIECDDGAVYSIKRVLNKDYTKKGDCQTTLFIDNRLASEDELLTIGIVLFQPPLSAPVLSQHTLNYLFTAKPSDRTSYFKALLEVTDLDEFRETVSTLEDELPSPDQECLDSLVLASKIPEVSSHFFNVDYTDKNKLEEVFALGAEALLIANGLTVPDEFVVRIDDLDKLLTDKRSKTFPLKLFDRIAFSSPARIVEDNWTKLLQFIEEKEKVKEETRKLVELFQSVLEIKSLAEAEEDQDCPVCGTEDVITADRIKIIRENVAATESYQSAKVEALKTLRLVKSKVLEFHERTRSALPQLICQSPYERHKAGFTIKRLEELLGNAAGEFVPIWLEKLKELSRKSQVLRLKSKVLDEALETLIEEPDSLKEYQSLIDAMDDLYQAAEALSVVEAEYQNETQGLYDTLKTLIDSHGKIEGWQEFVELARDLLKLHAAIVQKTSIDKVAEELKAALRQINKGVGKVLDEKFSDLTEGINTWWHLLRGGEPTFFSAVSRRGKDTIDFKGGLVTPGNEENPKIRDVIAVFSDSQLHCLGLAIFLARAEHYGTGFVVLDDPVLSSDEDYRVHFRSSVIQHLHDLGIQVIVITQHRGTWRDIASINEHLGVDQFQIGLADPAEGSTIIKTGDELSTMLASAAAYTNSDALPIRKDGGQKLRDAAERFCKMLLVKKQKEEGNTAAAISDYDNHRLGGNGDLVKLVVPYLSLNNSHPGKLRTIRNDLNPANHDDDYIPTREALKMALGDLKYFQKNYLS